LVAILLRACTSNGINPVAQTSVTADDNPPSVPFDPTTVVEPAALLRSGQPTCQLVVTSRVRLIVIGWLLPRLRDNPSSRLPSRRPQPDRRLSSDV
jgi:hypothetical protein